MLVSADLSISLFEGVFVGLDEKPGGSDGHGRWVSRLARPRSAPRSPLSACLLFQNTSLLPFFPLSFLLLKPNKPSPQIVSLKTVTSAAQAHHRTSQPAVLARVVVLPDVGRSGLELPRRRISDREAGGTKLAKRNIPDLAAIEPATISERNPPILPPSPGAARANRHQLPAFQSAECLRKLSRPKASQSRFSPRSLSALFPPGHQAYAFSRTDARHNNPQPLRLLEFLSGATAFTDCQHSKTYHDEQFAHRINPSYRLLSELVQLHEVPTQEGTKPDPWTPGRRLLEIHWRKERDLAPDGVPVTERDNIRRRRVQIGFEVFGNNVWDARMDPREATGCSSSLVDPAFQRLWNLVLLQTLVDSTVVRIDQLGRCSLDPP
ncbi:hypothetical protein CPLU01_12146 [Colletotrichum plurivorum]|uniref:Uncharacterized protein n=1 Tax=Colletotrichum plurivorum TaxID=2175906 RepID=A0A8H6N783_9PEZI|nr:hypothetical protein CPLU01_12146 [Colletotrichum plurivorum]